MSALLAGCLLALAEPPVGCYATAEGKRGVELRAALHVIIRNHHVIPGYKFPAQPGIDHKSGLNHKGDLATILPRCVKPKVHALFRAHRQSIGGAPQAISCRSGFWRCYGLGFLPALSTRTRIVII